jgi:hypothetical protein
MAARRSGVVLIALALWTIPIAAAPDPALDAIDACVRKLNPDTDIGYALISARCPDLAPRLEGSRWSAWLPRDWKRPGNDLSAAGLRELREFLSHPPAVGDRTPGVADLPAALASLSQKDSESGGWWERAKAWLREVFERREQAADDGWLGRLVARNGLSQAIIEIMTYIALTLVVLLATAIVFNELRIGGVLQGLRKLLAVRPVGRADGLAPVGLTREDIEKVSLSQQPRLLLELVIARLTEASCLPPARGLTVRELTRCAQLPDAADHARLADLARMSERVRFSDTEVPGDTLAAAVRDGWLLLDRLGGSRA